MSDVTLRDRFSSWQAITAVPDATPWSLDANWDNEVLLEGLLELLEDELEARFHQSPKEISASRGRPEGFNREYSNIFVPHIDMQQTFCRFFLATKLVEYCQMFGRTSLQFDWLFCALSNRALESIESGQPLDVEYCPTRLRQFMNSTVPVIRGTAPWTVLSFIRSLFYSRGRMAVFENSPNLC